MNIKEFFEKSAGQWLSQRTHYQLTRQDMGDGKAELSITDLAANTDEVKSLCEAVGFDINSNLVGVKVSWDNSSDYGKDKQKGSAILVAIPNAENETTGKIAQKVNSPQAPVMTGHYSIDESEAITLVTENDSLYTEERIWFANDNLRMRTSLIKESDRFSRAAFYSEIRRVSS
ncbi:MAG: phycobiliprotein lyase [Jaaginema sp. PMC 1079.18]|nr:phycobiliprotein lyase [Jaaginema sp. PMC 1080.18]MEC4853816.1 phycobiliprotein lyase [Jaaginema sp. PMC 1079.18]MEC4866068.1 phycobiliprotein lyase [Jaaginema sp. PMC 1078.18]